MPSDGTFRPQRWGTQNNPITTHALRHFANYNRFIRLHIVLGAYSDPGSARELDIAHKFYYVTFEIRVFQKVAIAINDTKRLDKTSPTLLLDDIESRASTFWPDLRSSMVI